MSSFTTPAIVELVDHYKFRLVEPFEYYIGLDDEHKQAVYRVPAGFETDLASVPRWLWALVPPHGKYAKAAILHDWLITEYPFGAARVFADRMFYDAMLVLQVPKLQAKLMYWAVRAYSIYCCRSNKGVVNGDF
jgi:hypothetical protein